MKVYHIVLPGRAEC